MQPDSGTTFFPAQISSFNPEATARARTPGLRGPSCNSPSDEGALPELREGLLPFSISSSRTAAAAALRGHRCARIRSHLGCLADGSRHGGSRPQANTWGHSNRGMPNEPDIDQKSVKGKPGQFLAEARCESCEAPVNILLNSSLMPMMLQCKSYQTPVCFWQCVGRRPAKCSIQK